jgi:predicted deacetylase
MSKKVLISLHDVAPFHLKRIQKAERLLAQWGVTKISYFFIPDYHQNSSHLDKTLLSGFSHWVRERQENGGSGGMRVEWVLHGYFHLETGAKAKSKFLTGGEGEFLSLSALEIDNRLREGKRAFNDIFHHYPGTFAAPAWLFNEHLIPALKKHGFRMTEDHSFIYFLDKEKKLRVPVITWATRTLLRRFTSRVGCPLLNRWWSGRDLVRVAVHPFDFDHPATIKSIEKVITDVLSKRDSIFYKELH